MTREETIFKEFGAELLTARRASGRSIDDIAVETKIHRRYIEAIEAGELGALPPGPYAKAFLREYARAMDLRVPAEFSVQGVDSRSKVKQDPVRKEAPAAAPAKPRPAEGTVAAIPGAAIKATKETARLANVAVKVAAKTAVKTTETVLKRVEESAKEAADVITSKNLWDEADEVRRERLGIVERPEQKLKVTTIPPSPTIGEANIPESPAAPQRQVAEPGMRESMPPRENISRETAPRENVARQTPAVDRYNDRMENNAPYAEDVAPDEGEFAILASPKRTERQYIDTTPRPAPKKKRSLKISSTYTVILAVVILFGSVAYYAMNKDKKEKNSPLSVREEIENVNSADAEKRLESAQSAANPQHPAPAPNTATQPVIEQPQAVATPQPDSLTFRLTAKDNVWVSIASDNGSAFQSELKKGETRTFKAGEKFTVNLGNQRSVDMTFNGAPLSHLPTAPNSGVVVRNLVLLHDKIMLNGQEVGAQPAANNLAEAHTPAVTSTPAATNAKPAAPHTATPAPHNVAPSSTPHTTTPAKSTPQNHAATTTNAHGTSALKPGTSKPAAPSSHTTNSTKNNAGSSTNTHSTKNTVPPASGTNRATVNHATANQKPVASHPQTSAKKTNTASKKPVHKIEPVQPVLPKP